MKYSKLKHDLELLELNQKHELQILKLKHEQQRNELINSCNHSYEDGTSARETAGTQWDNYSVCGICKKNI